ncbi:hypothetical protein TorRG33x02_304700 [Trema orientale]|uniref:Uncharacterized protein n=1 Tax=Trema orientale TaxID=63057 RepID=A0A2P5BY31_TREOI|nr:hypothetical protein TorRG33x02_304700 [Trema orientale]
MNRPRGNYISSSIWSGLSMNFVTLCNEVLLGDNSAIPFWTCNWLGYVSADRINIPFDSRPEYSQTISNYYSNGVWQLPLILIDIHGDIVDGIYCTIIPPWV